MDPVIGLGAVSHAWLGLLRNHPVFSGAHLCIAAGLAGMTAGWTGHNVAMLGHGALLIYFAALAPLTPLSLLCILGQAGMIAMYGGYGDDATAALTFAALAFYYLHMKRSAPATTMICVVYVLLLLRALPA